VVYVAAWVAGWLAIAVVSGMVVLLVFLIERTGYEALRTAARMSVMISAIGVSYLLQNLTLYLTGGLSRMYPEIPWISDAITVFGFHTRRVTVITPFLVIALVLILVWLINNTKIGIAMRAAAKDFDTSQLMGIKINSVISTTFIIGSFLAAIGSVLFFTSFPGVFPAAGAMPGLKAFVAAVFGGIGSIPGAVIGGLLIGVVETLIRGMDVILGPAGFGLLSEPLELATFSDAFTFILLVVILVIKPTGLFGDKPTEKV